MHILKCACCIYLRWYDMIWYDMIWYDMIWYDMIWYDMIWFTNTISMTLQPNGQIASYKQDIM